MSDTTPKPPCSVCNGAYKEHFDAQGKAITQHAYTDKVGDLVTHQEMAKRQSGSQAQRVAINPATLGGGSNIGLGRLVEVLVEKDLIGVEDALYVGGMGQKPSQLSGFRDPAERMS